MSIEDTVTESKNQSSCNTYIRDMIAHHSLIPESVGVVGNDVEAVYVIESGVYKHCVSGSVETWEMVEEFWEEAGAKA